MADEKTFPTFPSGPLPSGVVTFMFTDIVNSTKLKGAMEGETSGEREDAFHLQIKEPHEKIIKERLAARGGNVVEGTGDGFFIAFDDPEQAVLTAVEIQERLTAAAIPTPLGPLQVRVGVHSGRAKPRANAYTSSAADKAARVQSKVEGGLVLISKETYGLVDAKISTLVFAEVGQFDLKGLGTFPLYQAFRKDQNPDDEIAAAYRQHIIERFGKLTLYSLSSDQPIAVDLEQVFVKLTTKETVQGITLTAGEILRHLRSSDLAVPIGIPEIDKAMSALQSAENARRAGGLAGGEAKLFLPFVEYVGQEGKVHERTLTLSEALKDHSHLAIIGAPGAGKTTALRWLALAYARRQVKERLALEEDRLPLFVALRDFNRFLDNLEKTSGLPAQLSPALLARHLQEYYAEHVSHLKLPADFFLRALTTGKALVLLDGLDEVAVATKRTRAAEFVAACVRKYPDCRFVLSSRPRGYENDCRSHLAALCSECRVRDFDNADIAAFSTNWYLAVTIAREGDNPTTRDRAASAAKALQAAVQQERVRPLAANPLLLSILALIHQKGVGLPQRRVELYQECTMFLLGYWDQVKHGETGRELANLGGLTREEKCALLEPIALWIHERGEKGTEVSRKELEAQLAEQFRERFAETPVRAKVRAKEFVDIIELRAGLIVEREQDTFAFTHLTFQEYLAARALSDREGFVKETVKHLHEPWWREVHLLEVAHLSTPNTRRSREDTQKLIAAIRDAGSWLETGLHRDLLLAFHALCDVGPLGVETPFRQELTGEMLTLWRETLHGPLLNRIAERFSYAGATPVGSLLVDSFLSLTQHKSISIRSRAARALGNFGSSTIASLVLARLLELSQDTSTDVRSSAVHSLGKLDPAAVPPPVLARLLQVSQDTDQVMRYSAAQALANLGITAATPPVISRLFELCKDPNFAVRYSAADALGRMRTAAASSPVLPKLLESSQDPDAGVRSSAAYALATLGSTAATAPILSRLLELSQDPNKYVRSSAANALGTMGSAASSEPALVRLLDLCQDPDAGVRTSASYALATFGSSAAPAPIISKLLELSEDPNELARSSAAYGLGNMGTAAATEPVLTKLLKLSRDLDGDVRSSAAYALGKMGSTFATPPVLARLAEMVEEPDDDVRSAAAHALGKLGSAVAASPILARLLGLSQGPNADASYSAAQALGQMTEVLNEDITAWLASWWQPHLTNTKLTSGASRYTRYMDAAFDILQRLAARMPRTGVTMGKKSKAKVKQVSRTAKPKRAKKA